MSTSLMANYARIGLTFERGEGSHLYTADGERYLDFGCGIGVTSLGHAHPHVVAALEAQSRQLWHVSNLYEIPPQARLAERLTAATFADRVLFCNSGAEAMECALKLARIYQTSRGAPERYRVVTFRNAFHGRTLATIAAGGQAKHLKGFEPAIDAFDQVDLGDLDATRAAIGDETAALLVEPVQGEGGVFPASDDFLRGLRAVCDEAGLVLIFDEVQCGVGRTGRLFAHEWAGVTPDIMAVAKALGNGFPIGACLAREEVAAAMVPGSHGTTFGGNPLASAVGNAVLDVVLGDGFLDKVQEMGTLLTERLIALAGNKSVYTGVRGRGLMLGLECVTPNMELFAALRENKLLALPADGNVLRMLPPPHHRRGRDRRGLRRAGTGLGPGGYVTAPRHFLDFDGIDAATLRATIDRARTLKGRNGAAPLAGKTLAAIFESPSTRTRVSFEVAMDELGGKTIAMTASDMQLGRGETIEDTARVLSRYVDAIALRTRSHKTLLALAEGASVPVINALSDRSHPCQLVADVMTYEEHRGPIAGRTVAWLGDGNKHGRDLGADGRALRLQPAPGLPGRVPAGSRNRRLGQGAGRGR